MPLPVERTKEEDLGREGKREIRVLENTHQGTTFSEVKHHLLIDRESLKFRLGLE